MHISSLVLTRLSLSAITFVFQLQHVYTAPKSK